jgi:hypothetical protein
MYILRALAFLFLAQAVLAQQPTPILPDPKLTPGDTFEVTAQDVCVPGYAKKVRAVPAWLKKQAYAEYGITQYKTGDYEVDHLIPLSLGGPNSIRNLRPQLRGCALRHGGLLLRYCACTGLVPPASRAPSKKADLGTWEQPHARALRVVCLERLRASKGEVRCLYMFKWNSFGRGSLANG